VMTDIEILYSADGERALINKIRETCSIVIADSPFDDFKGKVTLFPNSPNGMSCGNGKAQSIIHALLLAASEYAGRSK